MEGVNPLHALIVGVSLLAAFAMIVWPETGAWARWKRLRQNTRRVHMEDALKHLYDCEYRGLVSTHQSVAGALGISADDATGVVERLESLRLLSSREGGFVLTNEGRSYALRVIRTHRLWERYLADETGAHETEWHAEAERKEHQLTTAETDALAIKMGNPRFDPHGDPIPTATGDVPTQTGFPLYRLSRGDDARIIHIEDEPAALYAQLVAQGLYPGVVLHVLEISPERVRFEVEGNEVVLAPIVAANVTVVPVHDESAVEEPHETLDALKPGESARVTRLSRRCRGIQRRRLMDLGLLPGTLVTAELQSASGDPTAYTIRGATIALRKTHAGLVHVRREETGR